MNIKKTISSLLFVLACFFCYGQSGSRVILKEDFANNKNNWPLNELSYRTSTIKDGKYVMKDSLLQDMWTGIPVAIPETGSYSITANATYIGGSDAAGYGISFGGKDVYDCYNFVISANGRYSVFKIEKSRITFIVDWTTDKHILTGAGQTNKLGILKQGQTWQFSINDAVVNSSAVGRFYGNVTGFEKAHRLWIEFDDLVVTDLNNGTTQAPVAGTRRDTIYPCQLIEKLPKYRGENFVSITGGAVLNSPSQNKYYCKFAVTSALITTISYFADNNYSFDAEFARTKTEAEAKKKMEEIKGKFEACSGKLYKLRNYISNASAFTVNTPTGFRELGIMLAVVPDASTNEYTVNLNTSSYDRESLYEYIKEPSDSSVLSRNLKEIAGQAQNKFAAVTGKKLNTDTKTYKTYYECKYQLTGALKSEIFELYNRTFEALLAEGIKDEEEASKTFSAYAENVKRALGKGYMFTQQTIKNWQSYNFYLNDMLYHSGMMLLIKEKETDGTYTIKLQVQSVNQ